ncbi:hypothetical protein GRX01_07080 [Halobaculum sp. WSA2]|uniref:Uncharacterized protein n=1 Tax=Halobaculum saliterrae TaxID=2073113 RepID=A0A6B0SYP6_9EURY|nr:hypothetical protein [Halobaculum saliterrae]MXR41100.1 hypothetical protein [Halobaculum saliterrae]
MDRRTVLSLAAGVGAAALAGCTGRGGGTNGGGDDDETDEGPEPTATETATETPNEEGEFPRITDRSFERTGDAAEPGESATVSFGTDLVTVTGVIRGNNGCMQASLKAAEYDRDANELRVRVETVREGGDTCTQQIVYRGYEAAVEFAGGHPGSVVVEHESMGEVRTVTDVTQ